MPTWLISDSPSSSERLILNLTVSPESITLVVSSVAGPLFKIPPNPASPLVDVEPTLDMEDEKDGALFTDADELELDDLMTGVAGVAESELSTVSVYVVDAVLLFDDESVALFCAICTDTVPSEEPLTTSKVYVVPLPAKLLVTGVPPFAVPDTVMSPITKSDTDSENVTV